MATAKEECFEEALDNYNDAVSDDKKIPLSHRQPWGQRTTDGVWEPQSPNGFWRVVNSMKKTIDFWLGNRPDPGTYQQVRVPDLTLRDNVVVDTKFTRADGTKDDWQTKPGAGNGRTQREDYNEINRQRNPNNKNLQDLKLDADSCGCKSGEPQPVEVWVPVPGSVMDPNTVPFMPMAPLGGVPLPGIPALPSLPTIPSLVPVPS